MGCDTSKNHKPSGGGGGVQKASSASNLGIQITPASPTQQPISRKIITIGSHETGKFFDELIHLLTN